MAAERRPNAGPRLAWTAILLAIPMGFALAQHYAASLGGIPSSGPLAILASGGAALLMGVVLVGVERIRNAPAPGARRPARRPAA